MATHLEAKVLPDTLARGRGDNPAHLPSFYNAKSLRCVSFVQAQYCILMPCDFYGAGVASAPIARGGAGVNECV
jgi:hypothetical protein